MNNKFKVGDWVVRKDQFADGSWLRSAGATAKHPRRVSAIKYHNFLVFEDLDSSWGPNLFNKISPPRLEFNESDYL